MRARWTGLLAILICTGLTATSAQPTAALAIAGVPKPSLVTIADLAKMPQETVELNEEGESVRYAGVLLSSVLTRKTATAWCSHSASSIPSSATARSSSQSSATVNLSSTTRARSV
jgi:hypothetical protein